MLNVARRKHSLLQIVFEAEKREKSQKKQEMRSQFVFECKRSRKVKAVDIKDAMSSIDKIKEFSNIKTLHLDLIELIEEINK